MKNHVEFDPSAYAEMSLAHHADLVAEFGRALENYALDDPAGIVPDGLEFPGPGLLDGEHPFDAVIWETRPATVKDEHGKVIFDEPAAEFPVGWEEQSRQIVAQKYFWGDHAQGFRETSLKQILTRVTLTIALWALRRRTFRTAADAEDFTNSLMLMQLHQEFSFNSPIYFNVGIAIYGPAPSPENWRWSDDAGRVVECSDANKHPQVSACFIQSVDDNMDSIMRLAGAEAIIFKRGSGTGSDLSTLRSRREKLAGGGTPSGPLSFMRVYDTVASVVKSGGKTRRAAKMQTMKVHHPDILDFITAKRDEERKAHALIAAGYEANFNGEAYSSVFFQNCNMSVRAPNSFMAAADVPGARFPLVAVTTGREIDSIDACETLNLIAECTLLCGDPGMQFEDTIQRWHTCPRTAPINSSNPCSEYMFIDDSACNLASLNLMKFRRSDGTLDIEAYMARVDVAITAMESVVDGGSYPTAAIARNSHDFRPLGLGYANLGTFIMCAGLAYDSASSRLVAKSITALTTARAYRQSALLARRFGPFAGFGRNQSFMLNVMASHSADMDCAAGYLPDDGHEFAAVRAAEGFNHQQLIAEAAAAWDDALQVGQKYGYRNSQATCIAPTGTIAFMMGCDTFGPEPEIALVRFKALAGRGQLKLVNRAVPTALASLGYSAAEVDRIYNHISKYNTIEDVVVGDAVAPSGLMGEHLPIFDCAFPPVPGQLDGGTAYRPVQGRSIAPSGHVDMIAAITPQVSGAVSKTVNMPAGATVKDIRDVYMSGWRKGCKALAVYVNASKQSQPITLTDAKDTPMNPQNGVGTSRIGATTSAPQASTPDPSLASGRNGAPSVPPVWIHRGPGDPPAPPAGCEWAPLNAGQWVLVPEGAAQFDSPIVAPSVPKRRRLPDTRPSRTHKFNIVGHEGYITVGFFEDGTPGEVFIQMSKQGSTVGGLLDTVAMMISLGLQTGVPMGKIAEKLAHNRFEPRGHTTNPEIRFAKSITDYLGQYLGLAFVPGWRERLAPPPTYGSAGLDGTPDPGDQSHQQMFAADINCGPCPNCGAILVRQGTCELCMSCGHTEGGCGG